MVEDDVLDRFFAERRERIKARVAELVEGRSEWKADAYHIAILDALETIVELSHLDGRKIDVGQGVEDVESALWHWINKDNAEELIGEDLTLSRRVGSCGA